MTHFLTTPKFDLLLYIGEKCAKNPYFYHFFWKKEVKLERNQKKTVVGINCRPWPIFPNITHLTHKFDLLSYISIINFLNLPVHALIHDLQKKNLRASTRTHDPFSDNSEIWPTFIYRGEVPADTFAKLPVRTLINDPKKLFQKKVYVTIPQWFETFPNMSDLWSGWNRANVG